MQSAFRILAALDAEILSREELSWQTGVDPRIIAQKLRFLRVRICTGSEHGCRILDWGVLDRERLTAFVRKRTVRKSPPKSGEGIHPAEAPFSALVKPRKHLCLSGSRP